MELSSKTTKEIEIWIKNHETNGVIDRPLYLQLLEERVRRVQSSHKLNFDRSLDHLKRAAIDQTCTTYGALAEASGVEWSQARHQMNGVNGHLDRLLDICHARALPLLTAICVNKDSVASGDLGDDALRGFIIGVNRLGQAVDDPREFHHACRDACWRWGRENASIIK